MIGTREWARRGRGANDDSPRASGAPPNDALRTAFRLIGTLLIACSGCANAARPPVMSLLEMRERDVVLQHWDKSCGAAAIVTLLRHEHGLDVTEREAALSMLDRADYRRDPDLLAARQGFSLLDLKRYADSFGLVGEGFGHLSLDALLTLVPVIVPVRFDGYDHFVVVRGVAADRIALADPAWGNRTMSIDRFVAAWIAFPALGRIGFGVDAEPGTHLATATDDLAPREDLFVLLR